MSRSRMKEELHRTLWEAQKRWFEWRARGETKRGLKLEGLREFGDLFARTRYVIFTGATRVAYERELKRFIDFVHDVRGKRENRLINPRDFRAYVEALLERGAAAKHLNKVKSAIAKFGALNGKAESFAAMSRKLGARIRKLSRSGVLAPPARPHVTPQVREAVEARLRDLDAASPTPRAYHLVVRLQQEASLRSIEATSRFTPACLVGGDMIQVLGKGGRPRTASISGDLYRELEAFFSRTSAGCLAPLRSYQLALRRATLAVGGRSTGSHSHRRTSAVERKNALYARYAQDGLASDAARQRAVEDTVEHLGHSRCRRDLVTAYLS